MHANRELYRLNPLSKFQSLLGLPTIRAFGKGNQFLNRHGDNMDLNRKIFIEQILVSTWFNLTLSLCSFIVNISAIIFCVFEILNNHLGLLFHQKPCICWAINDICSLSRLKIFSRLLDHWLHLKPQSSHLNVAFTILSSNILNIHILFKILWLSK